MLCLEFHVWSMYIVSEFGTVKYYVSFSTQYFFLFYVLTSYKSLPQQHLNNNKKCHKKYIIRQG